MDAMLEFKNVNFSYVVDDDEENKVTVDVLKNFNLTITFLYTPFLSMR